MLTYSYSFISRRLNSVCHYHRTMPLEAKTAEAPYGRMQKFQSQLHRCCYTYKGLIAFSRYLRGLGARPISKRVTAEAKWVTLLEHTIDISITLQYLSPPRFQLASSFLFPWGSISRASQRGRTAWRTNQGSPFDHLCQQEHFEPLNNHFMSRWRDYGSQSSSDYVPHETGHQHNGQSLTWERNSSCWRVLIHDQLFS